MPQQKAEKINLAEIFQTKEVRKSEFLSAADHEFLGELKKEFDLELQKYQNKEKSAPSGELAEVEQLWSELETIAEASTKDRLTGLENRRGLFLRGVEYFREAEAGEGERAVSVMSMDIDFFKAYNEISHTFGDLALQTVGQVLHESTKDSGFSVRLGGEEIFLLVDKELSSAEVKRKAEEIKNNIKDALNDLLSLLDERRGAPGSTKEFLENAILNESRNRKSFNEEMSKRPELAAAVEKARQLGLVGAGDMEPAEFVSRLKEKAAATGSTESAQWLQLKQDLGFDIGTITIGAARVEVGEERISEEDRQEIGILLKESMKSNAARESLLGAAEQGTYQDFYQTAERLALELSVGEAEAINDFLARNRQKRFGRIVDLANETAEKQKKTARNSVGIKQISMAELDSAKAKVLDPQIAAAYAHTRAQLEKSLMAQRRQAEKARTLLAADELEPFLARARAMQMKPEEMAIMQDQALTIQQQRYFDSLTLAKNYEYLVKVVPQELARARQTGHDYALVSFDVDNLKAINDTWGHKLGDVALMTVSAVMQEEIKKLPTELRAKVEAAGMEPSVIRATGGEEFIATFPGLNSGEAREVFAAMNRRLGEALRKFVNQSVPEDFNIDEKSGASYRTYADRIKEFIGQLSFEVDGKKVPRSEEEINKFGSVTAGVISLSEVREFIFDNGRPNAGKMRQLADQIGERLKKEVHVENGLATSGRGQVWGLEAYYLAVKLDRLEDTLSAQEKENTKLREQNASLKGQIADLRRQLKQAQTQKQISAARQAIEAL